MKNRLPIALSVTALVVALLGSTGAAEAVISFAANAGKLRGFAPSKTSKKNTVVVRGANGKIDARSIPASARGATGAPGAAGPTGPAGPKGDKGDKGDTGDTGAQGLQGIQGLKGDKGDKGDTGDVGPVGPTEVLIRSSTFSFTMNSLETWSFTTSKSGKLFVTAYLAVQETCNGPGTCTFQHGMLLDNNPSMLGRRLFSVAAGTSAIRYITLPAASFGNVTAGAHTVRVGWNLINISGGTTGSASVIDYTGSGRPPITVLVVGG
jgi:hypothetical protein